MKRDNRKPGEQQIKLEQAFEDDNDELSDEDLKRIVGGTADPASSSDDDTARMKCDDHFWMN